MKRNHIFLNILLEKTIMSSDIAEVQMLALPDYCLSRSEFMFALQDRGVHDGTELNTLKFKKIEGFARKLMKNLKTKNASFQPSNNTKEN